MITEFTFHEKNQCLVVFSTNFLLANVHVSLIQPVNQGIVQNRKCYYGRDFMKKFMHSVGTMKVLQSHSTENAILNDAYA